ncbi:LUB1 [Enterospora canceri]|uniref:LUB1 n=1 Tax=Enterospora canceri TaxID=1081671 RepID=A0A1Y1S8F4_9MICR|nr:LUB1 [Enterospora canceri]
MNGDLKAISADCSVFGGRTNTIWISDGPVDDDHLQSVPVPAHVNSVCSTPQKVVFVGLQNGEVRAVVKENDEFKSFFIYAHTKNVCAMDHRDGYLCSGGWDNNAILYISSTNVYISLFMHPESVWTVRILEKKEEEDHRKILTGCADGVIRVFSWFEEKQGATFKSLDYHNYPVRSILAEYDPDIGSDCIYSLDNDGNVFKFKMNGLLLNIRSLQGLCYTMVHHKDALFIGGENGIVYVLNRNLQVRQKIQLDCKSVWSIRECDGIVYAGGSDGCVHLIESCLTGEVPVIEKSKKNDNEINGDKKSKSEPIKDQVFTTDGKTYKVHSGSVYEQSKTGEWILIGQAEGKYDHSFNVELDGKNYTLSFNKKDNIYEVAREFIEKNNLQMSHLDEIVRFIESNFRDLAYKTYTNINIDGIKKIVEESGESDYVISELLRMTMDKEYKTEHWRRFETNLAKIEPRFIFYDIVKYLISRNETVDFSFVLRDEIKGRKQAKAFGMMLGNLVKNSPIKIGKIEARVKKWIDEGVMTKSDVEYYEHNRNLKRRSQN